MWLRRKRMLANRDEPTVTFQPFAGQCEVNTLAGAKPPIVQKPSVAGDDTERCPARCFVLTPSGYNASRCRLSGSLKHGATGKAEAIARWGSLNGRAAAELRGCAYHGAVKLAIHHAPTPDASPEFSRSRMAACASFWPDSQRIATKGIRHVRAGTKVIGGNSLHPTSFV